MKFSKRSASHGFLLAGLVALSFSARVSQARLETITLTSQDKVETGRWLFDPNGSPHGRAGSRALAAMKKARMERDFVACVAAAGKARKAAPELKAWVSIQELECATTALAAGSSAKDRAKGGVKDKSQMDASMLAGAISAAESIRDGFSMGVTSNLLRRAWVDARLVLIEQDVIKNRVRAQQGIERVEAVQNWLEDKQKAQLWRAAGEMSFAQQRLEEAREYFQRSLKLAESADLREKLASIDLSLSGKSKTSESRAKPADPGATAGEASDLEASAEENEIVTRMTVALKNGDLVSAVEDGIKVVIEFPGGTRAKWATDRILDVYLNLGDKTEDKYLLLRERVLKQMEKADADRLAEWARVGYNRGFYGDALRLARKALERMKDSARSTKTFSLAAEAALHVDQFQLAKEIYETLVRQHAGTPSAREALLRIGLIEYRLRNYQLAMAAFERLLVLPQVENFELTARHWLWRSLQKVKDEARAKEQAQIMITKFPFSYYGLRARAELFGGGERLEWPQDVTPKLEGKIWVTAAEGQAFRRAQVLIEAGWFDEAQIEMQVLPAPTEPAEKALRARLWAAAFHYPLAVKLVNEAWDVDAGLRKAPFLDVAFPREFGPVIEAQASTRRLEPALVMSLIKQESAYNIRAVSLSNAMGLMQI
ncbi:MAG: tetratricopeptide repeat protein, partial [Bdellovibrionaceae bacterium]|nr:tetratricopeptide repeat protein [Pseudobdellovibrionaceae bacterium]